MKYTLSVEIGRPREEVFAAFLDRASFKKWQPELVSDTPIDGEPNALGSTATLVHKMGKREVSMREEVVETSPPHTHSVVYEAKSVWNQVDNRFEPGDNGESTIYHFTSEFRCKGMIAVMARLMPGMFRKASLKYMRAFKASVEGAGGTNHG